MMETLPKSRFSINLPWRRRFRGQGLVEFTLILPVVLIVLFTIIEIARVLHAWLAIENGARFGVRYAVTGEYNDTYCSGYEGGICDSRPEEDAARIPSIKDSARSGAVAILRNETLAPGEAGFFKITVCSNKDGVVYFPPDPETNFPADCQPAEDGGGPGDRVSVTVDFDHPLIVPIISSWWPQIHLTARREGIVEQFRVARVVGLPATISVPSLTPTDTPIPPTPTDTGTPTSTPCKVPPVVDILDPESITYVSSLPAQARAWDPDDANPETCEGVGDDGQGINKVTFAIDEWNGSSWIRVHSHTENYVSYCGFGGDYPCTTFDLTSVWWPDGKPIHNGQHRMQAQAQDDEGEWSAVDEVIFWIDVPPTPTPTVTPTPSCDDIYITSLWISGDDLRARVRNNNPITVFLTGSSLTWTELSGSMYVNYWQYDWDTYEGSNSYDSPSSASPDDPGDFGHPPSTNRTWRVDFNNVPGGILYGNYSVTLVFDYVCPVSASIYANSPTPSRTPTITRTPTRTLTPSKTLIPSKTPTPSKTSVPPTNTKTQIPTNTSVATTPPPTSPPETDVPTSIPTTAVFDG